MPASAHKREQRQVLEMDGKGVWKTKGASGASDTARVVDRSVAFDCPEIQYRRRGYSPPFDDLNWSIRPDSDAAQEAPPAAARGEGLMRRKPAG
jgi:hypothetical protein